MQQDPGFLYSFALGALANVTELLTLGHVLTRISTEQQANPHLSLLGSLKSIYQKNGFLELYR